MPKLNFSGNLPNTIRNNILKLPVIPADAFSNIKDGVQDCHQNVIKHSYIDGSIYYLTPPPPKMTKGLTVFYPIGHIVNDSQSKSDP